MDNSKEYIEQLCQENEELVRDTAHNIWEYAELSLEEYKSSNYLVKTLENNGFHVKRGLIGYPTSFIAIYENGISGPTFGLLCEYDALPGLGSINGNKNGHGCGHNLFAAGAVGTAVSMRKLLKEQNLDGKIIVFGCPAEELYGSKPFFAKQGYFDGLTCILGFHPLEFNGVLFAQHNAIVEKRYVFHGKTSHAGAEPELGINALSAVELMHTATNYLREHVKSDIRVSYIIENGGIRPNIIPDIASTLYDIRGQNQENLQSVVNRIDRIAEGIAYGWGCSVEKEEMIAFANTIVNKTLAKLAYQNLLIFGGPRITEEDRIFIDSLGENLQLREDILPLPDTVGSYSASTDEGDASWCAPWIRVCTTCIAEGTPGHSFAVTAQADSPVGIKGTMQTIKICCATLYELLINKKLREDMLKEHRQNVSTRNSPSQNNSWPDIKRFPDALGVEKCNNGLIISCNENPLLPDKRNLRILVYDGELFLSEGVVTESNVIYIPFDLTDYFGKTLILKYATKDSEDPVLFGYYHMKGEADQ